MKRVVELAVSIVLHPVAFVLALINIIGRNDLNTAQKVIWVIVCLVWGLGPILYILVGGGRLW